jgi:hypothetical protein
MDGRWVGERGDSNEIYMPWELSEERVGMHARNQLLECLLSASADEAADFLFISWEWLCYSWTIHTKPLVLIHTSKVCPDLLCGIDVRWAIQIWLLRGKEGDDAQQLNLGYDSS